MPHMLCDRCGINEATRDPITGFVECDGCVEAMVDRIDLGEDCIPGKRKTEPDTLIGFAGR